MSQVTDVRFTRVDDSSYPALLKAYFVKKGHLVAVINKGGTRTVLNIDASLAVPGTQYNPSDRKVDGIYQVDVSDFLIDIRFGINDSENAGNTLTYQDSGNTFPKYLFKTGSETDTPEATLPAIPTWITTETQQQRTARIKRETVLALRKRVNKVAVDFDKVDDVEKRIHRDAQHATSHNKTGTDYICTDADPTDTDHLPFLRHGNNWLLGKCKTIGLAWLAIKLYNDATDAAPMEFELGTHSVGTTYAHGDYATRTVGGSKNNWIALQAHTATAGNAPGETGGTAHWKKALLDFVPTTVKKADGTSVAIDLSTGAGLDDLVTVIETEFKINQQKHWRETVKNEAHWTTEFKAQKLHTTGSNWKKGDQIAEVKIVNINSSAQPTNAATRKHSEEMWVQLYEEYLDALTWEAPASS